MDKKIFISYSNDNSEKVTDIVNALEFYGVGCWFQIKDSKLDYAMEIEKGISASKAFVVFITDSSIRSFMVKNEITRAIKKLSEEPDYRIIPIILEDIPLEDFHRLIILLGSVNWIFAKNFYSEYELARRVLLDADIDVINSRKKDNYNSSNKTEKERLLKQARLLERHISKTMEEFSSVCSILDIGCADGSGVMLKLHNNEYKNFCGIDINPVEIDKANSTFGDDKHTFINCDVMKDSFSERMTQYMREKDITGFDLVMVSYVLLHIEDPLKMLEKLKSVMNPNAAIIIQEHDDGASLVYPQDVYFDNVFTLWKNARDSGDRYTARKIPILLKEAGFSNITIKESSFSSVDFHEEYKEALWDFFFNVDYWNVHDAFDFHDPSVFNLYKECENVHAEMKERYMNGEYFLNLGMFIFVAYRTDFI